MKAKYFVLQKYPNACHFRMIDNPRRQTSSVIIKDYTKGDLKIFENHGAENESKAWTNAKRQILKETTTKQ